MNLVGWKSGLLGGAAALALVVSVPAYAQDDVSTLRQQLEAMKERLGKLEADKAEKRRVSAAAAVEAGDKPRSWKLPGTNTSMNIGGFIKMSTRLDFSNATATTGLGTTEGLGAGGSPATIDNSGQDNVFNGGHFQFTARRSRFWIQTWTPTDWGELQTYIEADFAGGNIGGSSNNLLRLRRAYGTLGPVLIGKTQTLFGGFIGLPELLDDGAPMAPGALRIEQIRYTHNFGGGLTLSVALEDAQGTSDAGGHGLNMCGVNPSGSCTPLAAATFGAAGLIGPQRWPDVTAALQWNFPNGALYASGVVGQISVDSGGPGVQGLARDDNAIKWGASLGGRYDFGRVEIGGQGWIGQGIGRKYLDGGATGFRDGVLLLFSGTSGTNGAHIETTLGYGALGYVQVKLTDTIRATGAYNWGMVETSSEVPGYYGTPAIASVSRGTISGVTNYYVAAYGNLLWNPVPQVTLGAEYSYQFASRYNSPNTTIQRLQLSAIYRF